jgi:mono/diheme cytochrome c family protein
VRRTALIAILAALMAGCGGEETVSPAPETVEGEPAQTQTQAEQAEQGDPTAGKAVYDQNGCGGCHRFGPANSDGTTGPNLDQLEQHAQQANQGTVEEYTRESITDPNAYLVPGFPEGVMPPYDGLEEKQLNDLVAFLTQS